LSFFTKGIFMKKLLSVLLTSSILFAMEGSSKGMDWKNKITIELFESCTGIVLADQTDLIDDTVNSVVSDLLKEKNVLNYELTAAAKNITQMLVEPNLKEGKSSYILEKVIEEGIGSKYSELWGKKNISNPNNFLKAKKPERPEFAPKKEEIEKLIPVKNPYPDSRNAKPSPKKEEKSPVTISHVLRDFGGEKSSLEKQKEQLLKQINNYIIDEHNTEESKQNKKKDIILAKGLIETNELEDAKNIISQLFGYQGKNYRRYVFKLNK
jgi:hypothetical protein